MQNRTDLALELKEEKNIGSAESGIIVKTRIDTANHIKETKIIIKNKKGEISLGKPKGSYITIEAKNLSSNDGSFHKEMSEALFLNLKEMLGKRKKILIAGLGNANVTADSLGPKVVNNLCITRHLEREGIVCVTMPCFGTTNRTYDNAVQLAKQLGTSLREIRIQDAVMQHFKDISHDPAVQDVTYENGQARERTQILMDIANQVCGMVIGTGDMSELALGWATYNGDHMSMYGVNCSVPKTLVRYLVQFFADTCENDILKKVLYDVLDTPVSPELLPPKEGEIAQKTEDLVGPYELHDFFLYYTLRLGYGPEKIFRLACVTFEGAYDKKTIAKWLNTFFRRFFAQQFKRSCLPDGPKVGTVSVSPRGDLRMPSDASRALWQTELDRICDRLV